MWFKDFQIRAINKDFEIVKWNTTHSSCYVIAFLRWDEHEENYNLNSVGMRLVNFPEVPGLLPWISAFVDYQYALKRIERGEFA